MSLTIWLKCFSSSGNDTSKYPWLISLEPEDNGTHRSEIVIPIIDVAFREGEILTRGHGAEAWQNKDPNPQILTLLHTLNLKTQGP